MTFFGDMLDNETSQIDRIHEFARRLSGIAIVAADITDKDIPDDMEGLVASTISFLEKSKEVKVIDARLLKDILGKQNDKAPEKIDVSRSAELSIKAKDIDTDFQIKHVSAEHTQGDTDAFVEYFNDRFARLRKVINESGRNGKYVLTDISRIKQYSDGREVTITGMVNNKIITKNGNILVTLEDATDSAKVLFMKQSGRDQNIFDTGARIAYDDVIAVTGKISGPFVIANGVMYPDIPIRTRKQTEEDFAIAFLSDVHVGSKRFLEKSFIEMLKWANGGTERRKDLLSKLKYIVISGDVVDGIGVYPNQDKDLGILDIYKQYSNFFDLIKEIPDYIEIFVLPGNHDAVQLAEPQPPMANDIIGDFRQDNVHIISNPCYIRIHELNVLAYHGASLDPIIQYIPGCSYAKPETAMIETLKRRHLSPIYGGNEIVPSKQDNMVMTEVPDILHMGHIHKNGYADYHGTLVVNSGTWQDRTDYQIKHGHIPSPAIMPIYETKLQKITEINFA